MNINYNRLFNLTIGHDYFVDGFDRFVQLAPTQETSNLLKNGKMLFKKLPHGVTVLYRATDDEVSPFIDLDNDQRLVFVMTTENITGLLNISDLDESVSRQYKSGSILYFKNDPASASANTNNPEIITHELIDTLRSQLFSYSFTITGNPATVQFRVADEEGGLVSIGKETDGTPFPTTLTLSINSNNEYTQQIDLRDKPKGRYKITILDSTGTTTLKEEEIYVDELLAKQNILGIVDIVYETAGGHLYGDTEAYKVQFTRADVSWKYYIINKSQNIDLSTNSLSISDAGSTNGSPYEVNDFSRAYSSIELTADSPGPGGNTITLGYSGGGDYPAVALSAQSLSGGADGVEAEGMITIINNDVTGYTVSIGGIDFTEGSHFSNGTTPADTAAALILAINGNGSVTVLAESLGYDVLINDLQTLVFSSEQTIPFYENPKLMIELLRTSDDVRIVEHLPNPSHNGIKKVFADRLESEVYVFI